MELMRLNYTHLDPLTLIPESLPIELFVSYEKWIGSLSRRVMNLRSPVLTEIQY